jgi:hypothetical protein
VTLVVDENLDLALLHHTDAGVCGSQINTDNWWRTLAPDHELEGRGLRKSLPVP